MRPPAPLCFMLPPHPRCYGTPPPPPPAVDFLLPPHLPYYGTPPLAAFYILIVLLETSFLHLSWITPMICYIGARRTSEPDSIVAGRGARNDEVISPSQVSQAFWVKVEVMMGSNSHYECRKGYWITKIMLHQFQ